MIFKNKKQRYILRIIKRLLKKYPKDGKKHIPFFKDMYENKEIPIELAAILVHIIENPKCSYEVLRNGTIRLNRKNE